MTDLSLPPAYRARMLPRGRRAVPETIAAARAGEAEGLILWADRADRLDAALLLKPDHSRAATLPVIYAAGLAFADALGAFSPPPAPIAFRWPGGIEIDGAFAGSLALRLAPSTPGAVPDWAVLGLDLALAGDTAEPGTTPYKTNLAEEGFEDFSVPTMLEGFSRHLLLWLNIWDRDGLDPVAREWARRCFDVALGREADLPGGKAVPLGIDGAGNLRARAGGRERIVPLEPALAEGGDG